MIKSSTDMTASRVLRMLFVMGLGLLLAALLMALCTTSAFAEEPDGATATETTTDGTTVNATTTDDSGVAVNEDAPSSPDTDGFTVLDDTPTGDTPDDGTPDDDTPDDGTPTEPEPPYGWKVIGGNTYYYDPLTLLPVKEWQKIDGAWYYFDTKDGKMFKGLLHYKDGGWFYLNPDTGKMHTGWLTINADGTTSATGTGGGTAANSANSATYYFRGGDSGRAYKEWFKTGGYWYFFDTVTAKKTSGWVKNSGGWFYLDPDKDGKMHTGWLKYKNGRWYYLRGGDSGRMVTGWLQWSGDWYYLRGGDDGSMVTGWQYLSWSKGSSWFYFKGGDNGRMVTGWLYIDKKWEFFSTVDGNHIRTGGPGRDNAYVEVDLTRQKMWYVKNGRILLESDVVTGNYGSGTPTGAFVINSRVKGTTLVGPGYAAPVSYWMPFVGNMIGFHDATWQPWFGGSRYRGGGSHGCVNMPLGKAQELYNLCSSNDSVVIHW